MTDLGTTLEAGSAQMLELLARPDVLRALRLRTGQRLFDKFVCPRRGQMIVLGAENGSGKSTYLLQLLISAAEEGEKVALFSVEDVAMLLRARLLGLYAGINPVRILDADLTREDHERLKSALLRASQVQLTFFEGVHGLREIRARLADLSQAGFRFVAIDYLQTLSGVRAQDRRNEIRAVAQELALFAREARMCLILVSQVVRPQSRTTGAEPNRHWLKEAGDIADAADKIIMLWRDQDGSNRPTQVKLDKDKDGRHLGARWELALDRNSGRLLEQLGGVE